MIKSLDLFKQNCFLMHGICLLVSHLILFQLFYCVVVYTAACIIVCKKPLITCLYPLRFLTLDSFQFPLSRCQTLTHHCRCKERNLRNWSCSHLLNTMFQLQEVFKTVQVTKKSQSSFVLFSCEYFIVLGELTL